MTDKRVSETLEQFVQKWIMDACHLYGQGENIIPLARAVERRTAERCAKIAYAGGSGAREAQNIRRAFKLEPK